MDEKLVIITMIICGIILGWAANEVYDASNNHRTVKGAWIGSENVTLSEAKEYSESRDSYGSWICINIRGMTIGEMVETCEHEAGHEIFARSCTGNITKCMEKLK